MKKHLPSVILAVVLLLLWQGIAMIIDAAYILPSPTQICVRLWELREPLFLVHLPRDYESHSHWAFDFHCAGDSAGSCHGCQ